MYKLRYYFIVDVDTVKTKNHEIVNTTLPIYDEKHYTLEGALADFDNYELEPIKKDILNGTYQQEHKSIIIEINEDYTEPILEEYSQEEA